MPLAAVFISDYRFRTLRSPDLNSWPARGGLATHLGQGTVAMAHALDEIVQRDRGWFWAHPERQHRCRWPETCELDPCDRDRDARLVIAIRHLGHGCIVYQPVFFQGALPYNEESTAALFALAGTSPEPIPVLAQMDVWRRRRSMRQQTKKHESSNVAGGINGPGAERAAPG
jgi:hypothetical protein